MGVVTSLSLWWIWLYFSGLPRAASEGGQDPKKLTVGQNFTLACRASNTNPIIVIEWSRTDLENEYVLLYRDKQIDLSNQHPSFKNRVDLQDRQMKDGDVSVILKNVTVNDTGTYECRVIQRRTNRWKRANLKTAPINIINLSVVPPPGPTGGATEDGGNKGEGGKDRIRNHYPSVAVLSVTGVIILIVVISLKIYTQRNSHLSSSDENQKKNLAFFLC